jgi:hypothetical protein
MTLYRRNNSQLVQLPVTRTDLEFGDTSTAPFASAVNLSIAASGLRRLYGVYQCLYALCHPVLIVETA